ncbi:hypothetical protein [Arenimonas sp.]|uniref:hypothetical protein n=1 Tax=Arenimonas sp. TaxID=1872635 RepID=UPI0039E4FF5D
MTYVSTSIDRRAQYYARISHLIASDPLGFYSRAEKGRQYLASRHAAEPAVMAANVVSFTDARRKDAPVVQAVLLPYRMSVASLSL